MMRPRMIKLAATSGVGAMTRVTALWADPLSKGQERTRVSQFTHCMINGVSLYGF